MSWFGGWYGRWFGGWYGRFSATDADNDVVAAIVWLLQHNVALLAAVPAARIFAGVVPLETALPAISVSELLVYQRLTLAMNSARVLARARIQVSVLADTHPQQKSVIQLVRDALPHTRGTLNGVLLDSILPDVEGPDFRDDAATIFMQSQDYIVKFNR